MKATKPLQLIAAPFTPMDQRGDLNLEMISRYANHLIDAGISGVFLCGTSGEGISLSIQERKSILEEWINQANGKLKVISHVGGNCLRESMDLAVHAEQAGASAIASFAPSFFKPASVEELVSFLEPIASSAPGLPFYFYHIPSLTGVNIPVSHLLISAGKRIPNFAGVKFTHHDLYEMQKCMTYNNNQYEIFHGFDETLLCGLSLGIHSAVGSTYNYMSRVYFNLFDAYKQRDFPHARAWQQVSVKVVNILNKYGGGVRAGKAIMNLIGLDCGPCRLPINYMTNKELESLKSELDDAQFFETG